MKSSISRRDLRAERRAQSPYSRPEPVIRRTVSHSAFSPLSSLVKSVSSFFNGSTLPRHTQDADGDIDINSQSGSEDEWNGEPPEVMKGQDVYSLAAAAGRGGEEFEERAKSWRAGKGLLSKSTHQDVKSPRLNWSLLDLSDSDLVGPTPSRPAPTKSYSRNDLKTGPPPRALARVAESSMPSQTMPSSASSVALKAFLDAKAGQPLGDADIHVIESLTRNMKREAHPPRVERGGWSAASLEPETPTAGAAMTPVRGRTSPSVSSSSPAFSLGSNAPLPALSSSQRKVTYLGPGMSPRRLYNSTRSSLKPRFQLNLDPTDDSTSKKRRVDDDIEVEALDSALQPEADAAAEAAAAYNAKGRERPFHPSPLSQSSLASPAKSSREQEIVKAGKKRAQDILSDLFDKEVGPANTSSSETIIINPYETVTPAIPSGKHISSRSSLRKSSSGMRLSLRSSTSLSRGAAQKIERLRDSTPSHKLTTLEMVGGVRTGSEVSKTRESDDEQVDSIMEEPEVVEAVPAPKPVAAPKPAFVSQPAALLPKPSTPIPQPDTYKPFSVPTLSSSTLKSSTSTPTPRVEEPVDSAAVASIFEASKPAPLPKFTPAPVAISSTPEAPTAPAPVSKPASSSRRFDPSAVYLSAKDSALAVDKAALPFFTFTVPIATGPAPSEAVKTAAGNAKQATFEFTHQAPAATATLGGFRVPAKVEGEWTCDTCLLKNPPEATEKCKICDAKRPSAASVAAPVKALPAVAAPAKPPVVAGGFKTPGLASGEWTCDTCMLKNPATATENCTICDAPKPGAAPAKPVATPATAMPAAPSGGFTFGAKPAAPAGEWTCDTCMLKNPATATEKCTICDAKKPGAAPAKPVAAPAPSIPAAPSGGFSFGAKTPAPAGEWTCDTCMLKNPATATDKCTICDAPKPGAAPAKPVPVPAPTMPAAPSGGFSFGAKPAAPAGEWTCDTCMLKNPATATEKCTICEAKKPGATSAPPSAPKTSVPAPPAAGGFSFGGKPVAAPPAGGFSFGGKSISPSAPSAPAAPAGGFTFGGFKPTTSSSSGSSGGFKPSGFAAPSGGFSFGKPASAPAASAKAPQSTEGQWECSTCMLKNPASATDKCTICDSPR